MDPQTRLFDKLESIAVSIGVLQNQVSGVNNRLDTLNSKVATHSVQINQHEVAAASRASDALLHSKEISELKTKVNAIANKGAIDSGTWLKIVGLVCLTSAAIFGVSSGKIVETLIGFVGR